MSSFATPQDLATYLSGDILDENEDAEFIAQAELLLELVSDDIRSAARNPIVEPDPNVETLKLAGSWERDLIIPGRPIQAVTAVEVNGYAVDYTFNGRETLRIGAGTLPTVFSAAEGPAGDVGQGAQGSEELDVSTGHWGGPTSTVSVTLTRGAEAVPGVVRSLCIRVGARVIGNPTGLTQETLGPYAASYGQLLNAGGTHLTDKETKMLRKKFSRTAGTVHAGSIG